MTRPIDFERATADWLADGPTAIADRALQAALDEVHLTHQRRAGAAWRTFEMNRGVLAALGVAAVLVLVAVLGLGLFGGGLPGNLIGGQPTPSPSPSPTPRGLTGAVIQLPAGEYVTTDQFLVPGIGLTLGDRWKLDELKPSRLRLEKQDPTLLFDEMVVSLEVPTAVHADPCLTGSDRFDPSTGPTIDDFIGDLRRVARYSVGPVTSTTIDGVSAVEFDLSNDIPEDRSGCNFPDADPPVGAWDTGDFNSGPAQRITLLQVAGKRLLISVAVLNATPTTPQEIEELMASVNLP